MTPLEQSRIARDIAHLAPIIPVLVIEDVAHARPLAEALVRGHLPALEVTLRTEAALDAIAAMAEVPGGVVGAGTLLTPQDVRAAKAAGAKFGVSPGATDTLIEACIAEGLPLLPGAATASEAMRLSGTRLRHAEILPRRGGGRRALSQVARRSPAAGLLLPHGRRLHGECARIPRLPNVICAGGSWVAPAADADGRGLGRDRGAGAGRIRARLGGPPPLRPRPAERKPAPARNGAEHQSVSCGTGPASPLAALREQARRRSAPSHRANERTNQNETEQDSTPHRRHCRADGHAQPRRASGAGRRRRRTRPDAGGGSGRPGARRRHRLDRLLRRWADRIRRCRLRRGDR
jgi:2-dehydro-3-deoxyphosphogluconate aldolase/(4S)-4-hydroxy-2-oxoglutarate aldolase